MNKSSFSIWKKEFIFVPENGIVYDLSKEIPDKLWRPSYIKNDYDMMNNPETNWKIRCGISEFVNKYVKETLGLENVRIVL